MGTKFQDWGINFVNWGHDPADIGLNISDWGHNIA